MGGAAAATEARRSDSRMQSSARRAQSSGRWRPGRLKRPGEVEEEEEVESEEKEKNDGDDDDDDGE